MPTITALKPKIGIIAGYGDFPNEVCSRAKEKGYQVNLCAVKGEADPGLASLAENVIWVKLGEIGKLLKFFSELQVKEAVLCGKIHKVNILSGRVIPDFDTLMMMTTVRNFKDDSLLNAFCGYLEKKGIKIIDSTLFLDDSMLEGNVLTLSKPSGAQMEEISFGFNMAKEMSRLDIGQTVVVKNKSVVAVESVEGTDETILRGGRLAGKGAIVVKVAKPNQDMRFDVPTIGPDTLESCLNANVAVLAFEAGKTIVLHSKQVVDMANKKGLILVAFNPEKMR